MKSIAFKFECNIFMKSTFAITKMSVLGKVTCMPLMFAVYYLCKNCSQLLSTSLDWDSHCFFIMHVHVCGSYYNCLIDDMIQLFNLVQYMQQCINFPTCVRVSTKVTSPIQIRKKHHR